MNYNEEKQQDKRARREEIEERAQAYASNPNAFQISVPESPPESPDRSDSNELVFWGRPVNRIELKKKTIRAIFLIHVCAFDLINRFPDLNDAIVRLAEIGGISAELRRPTDAEAFAYQQLRQRIFMSQPGATPQMANANAERFFQQGMEERIRIGNTEHSLRDWIDLVLRNTLPDAIRIPFATILSVVEIIYKSFNGYGWVIGGLQVATERIATEPNGVIVGVVNELISSMSTGGLLAGLGQLTGTQLLVLSVCSTTLVLTGAQNPIITALRSATSLTLRGIDSIIEYIAIIFLSDDALHSLVLPGPTNENDNEEWREWSKNANSQIQTIESISSDESSYGELNGARLLTNNIISLTGGMALTTATIAAIPARLVVVGFRSFYESLFNQRKQDEDSDWESIGSFESAEGGLEDVSVYTLITNVSSVNEFVTDTHMILDEVRVPTTENIGQMTDYERIISALELISVVAANSVLPPSCGGQPSRQTTSMSIMSDLTSVFDPRSDMNRCIGINERSETIVANAFEDVLLRVGGSSGISIKDEVEKSHIDYVMKQFKDELDEFERLRMSITPPRSPQRSPPRSPPGSLSPLTQSPLRESDEEKSGGRRSRKHRKVSKNKTKKSRKSKKTHKRRRRFKKSKKSKKY
jgi:hypothetical protein